jgi:hypothetical protein
MVGYRVVGVMISEESGIEFVVEAHTDLAVVQVDNAFTALEFYSAREALTGSEPFDASEIDRYVALAASRLAGEDVDEVPTDGDPDGNAAVDGNDSAPTAEEGASPDVDDVAIEYLVLEEDCFDTAGSLMEVELSPARAAWSDLSLDEMNEAAFLVTYDITNIEGGVTRDSILVEQGRFNSETERLSFARCNTNPNIVVTGPYRAPGIRVGDREPITHGGRVMWGLERAADYNSAPVIGRTA